MKETKRHQSLSRRPAEQSHAGEIHLDFLGYSSNVGMWQAFPTTSPHELPAAACSQGRCGITRFALRRKTGWR